MGIPQKITKITTNLTYITAILAAFTLAFPREHLNFLYVAWLIAWGIEILFRGKYSFEKPNKNNIQLYLLWIYFGWMLISILWTDNLLRTEDLLLRRIIFFIVPLLTFFGMKKDFQYKKILLAFVLGTFASIITALIYSYIKTVQGTDYFIRFFDHYQVYKHHTYFGLCKIFSIIIILYLKSDITKRLPHVSFYYIGLATTYLFFGALIYLSEARMPLIILVVVTATSSIYFLWGKSLKIIMSINVFAIAIVGTIIVMNHPRMQDFEFSKEKLQEFDPRYDLWRNGYQCIKESNLVFGVGIGDYTDVFSKNHAKPEFQEHFFPAESCHNHFMDVQLELGIIGSIIFLYLLYSCFLGIKDKNKLFFVFNLMLIWVLFFMIENLALKNTTIYMFSFSLLVIYWMKKNQILLNEKLKKKL